MPLIITKHVIPAKAGIQIYPPDQVQDRVCETCPCENKEEGTSIKKNWIPPHQVQGRLSQARNDKQVKVFCRYI
jgi:hypothetical protein